MYKNTQQMAINQIQQWYIKNIIHYNQVELLFQEYKDGSTYDLTNVSHQHLTVSEDEEKLFEQSHYTIKKIFKQIKDVNIML